jgi:TonB family protein
MSASSHAAEGLRSSICEPHFRQLFSAIIRVLKPIERMMSEVTAARTQQEPASADSPVLLRELESWPRAFFRNLGDLVFRREPPPVEISAKPVELRRDYFIKTGIAPVRFLESYSGHIAFVIAVYLVCTLPFFNRQPLLQNPAENTSLQYVPVSDYLPPINTAAKQQMKARKGAPKLAKQEILSVPANPDNTHQTIITPPKVKLNKDVALPNIVAWTPIPSTQPVAASARSVSQLTVPQFQPEVVAPTADLSHLKNNLKLPAMTAPTVVAPSADVAHVKDNLKLPPLPQAAVVEPTLSPDQLRLKQGQLNMADLQPAVEAPKLPVAPQRSSGASESGGAAAAKAGDAGGKSIPPPPNVQGLGNSQGQGQIIALSLNPADVRGPVNLPSGNRSGEFHASPSGKADAPGTPNVTGSGSADHGGGRGTGSGALPGIVVGAPPPGANTSTMAGTGGGNGNGNGGGKPSGASNSDATRRIFAEAMKPSMPAYHQPSPSPSEPDLEDPEKAIERQVFGSRRYYSLIMNMPNLTSATGSWIIRFAELKQTDDKVPLTAPVATSKMDPAYPADALRDHVEGTVTLYAIIRPDGSVDSIRVLNSLDERLDQNAIRALSHWHFRPGTKNGEPVAVEAVVQIPFRMHSLR